ncbi:MAG: serine hydrolase [Acidobacteriota bacterium]
MKLQNRLRLLLIAGLTLSLCAFSFPSSANTPQSVIQKNKTTSERIARIENGLLPALAIKGKPAKKFSLIERLRFHKVPGVSVAVINNYAIEWAKGYGVKDVETNEPVTVDTMFQAASISKPVATIGMLRLVQAGQLNLDEDVNVKLKSWKVPDTSFVKEKSVTLRELVSHSAGLTVHGFRGYAATETVPTLVQLLNGEKPANSARIINDIEPQKIWRYSGGGFCVMQLLMTDTTGKAFPQIMQEKVLSRIGMTNSTYRQPLPVERAKQAATGHRASGQIVKGKWHTYPEMAAAGLWTTPMDLAKLAIEVQKAKLGKSARLLSQAMTEQMLTRQFQNWGLGFNLEGKDNKATFGHGGANEGFRCQLTAFVNGGQGAVVMTNSDTGGALAQEIIRAIAAEYGWAQSFIIEREVASVDAKVYQTYVGEYTTPLGKLSVTVEGDSLLVELQGQGKIEIYPESEVKYFTPEVANLSLVFNKDENGKTISITIRQGAQEIPAKRLP